MWNRKDSYLTAWHGSSIELTRRSSSLFGLSFSRWRALQVFLSLSFQVIIISPSSSTRSSASRSTPILVYSNAIFYLRKYIQVSTFKLTFPYSSRRRKNGILAKVAAPSRFHENILIQAHQGLFKKESDPFICVKIHLKTFAKSLLPSYLVLLISPISSTKRMSTHYSFFLGEEKIFVVPHKYEYNIANI